MSQSPNPKSRRWQVNLIFTLVILLAAGGLWLARSRAGSGAVAVVDFGGGIREELPLDTDHDYYYQLEEGVVHLQVLDGAVAFLDSQCPDHVCENFGWLTREGDWASCIPFQVYLSVEGNRS